ncbi:hypothetical protein AB4K20DRAFT_1815415 [Rhizopus microsporus]
MKELTYFGEVVSYLRHTSPDGISRLLVLVKVIDVKTNKDVFDHTRPSSAIFQIKVANAYSYSYFDPNKVKDVIRAASSQIDKLREEIKGISIKQVGQCIQSKRRLLLACLRIVFSLSPATEHPFNKGLDKKLMENVHGGSTDDKVFKTACDYFGFFRLLAIICKIRDPQRKFRATKLVEKKLAPFALLRTRVDSWVSD